MKKFLLPLICVLSINLYSYATTETLKEEILDLSNMPAREKLNIIQNEEKEDQFKKEAQDEGMDYMYRMQQQMMRSQPTNNWNPMGGIRY